MLKFCRARYIDLLESLLEMVDPYNDKMEPAQLKDCILSVMPELKDDPECQEGLFRLSLMVSDDYISAGYYLLDGGIMHITFLSGDDSYGHVAQLQDIVGNTVGDRDGTGYFFITNAFDRHSDEEAYDYSHFFSSLP